MAILITTPPEIVARQSVGGLVVPECSSLRIETGNPLLGGDPQPAGIILENAANLVFGFTSDDDMCIFPGTYYDVNDQAPPGADPCDLSLLSKILN